MKHPYKRADHDGPCGPAPEQETTDPIPIYDDDSVHVHTLRTAIADQYTNHPTGAGRSFGEILCWEIHANGMTFAWLADKWGLSLATLGELIWDHCKRLEARPRVNHQYQGGNAGTMNQDPPTEQ